MCIQPEKILLKIPKFFCGYSFSGCTVLPIEPISLLEAIRVAFGAVSVKCRYSRSLFAGRRKKMAVKRFKIRFFTLSDMQLQMYHDAEHLHQPLCCLNVKGLCQVTTVMLATARIAAPQIKKVKAAHTRLPSVGFRS